jgi:hypothetical protein
MAAPTPPPLPPNVAAPTMEGRPDVKLRIRAALLDNLFLLILTIAVLGSTGWALDRFVDTRRITGSETWEPLLMIGLFLTLILVTFGTYFGLTASSPKQATWGQRLAGLKLVDDRTGARPRTGQTWTWAVLQALTRFLNPALGLGLFVYLPILSHPRGQSPLDSVTHLLVVEAKS